MGPGAGLALAASVAGLLAVLFLGGPAPESFRGGGPGGGQPGTRGAKQPEMRPASMRMCWISACACCVSQ
jgi:hypothetical protein